MRIYIHALHNIPIFLQYPKIVYQLITVVTGVADENKRLINIFVTFIIAYNVIKNNYYKPSVSEKKIVYINN